MEKKMDKVILSNTPLQFTESNAQSIVAVETR